MISLNEASNLRRTVENLEATLPPASEILVIDDGSTDGSTDFLATENGQVGLIRTDHWGIPKARNLGASRARGDVIVFADAHVTVQPGWWRPLVEVLENPRVGGVAPVISDMNDTECKGYGLRLAGPDPNEEWLPKQSDSPYPAPLLGWGFAAMRRDAFEATGGFDAGMIRCSGIDNEFSLRLWLLGYELWIAPQTEVFHLFREQRPYHAEWSWVLHNKLRLAFVHFGPERIARVVAALRDRVDFASAVALAVDSDFAERRRDLAARRVHDDAWFFEKFGPSW